MNDLNETLKDIARGQCPHPGPLDEAIDAAFDFYDHMTEEPTYASRDWKTRNSLLAAYILEAPGDIGEIIAKMEIFDADTWAQALEPGKEMAFSIIKVAAERAFEQAIDDRIADMFRDYCDSNGIYASQGRDQPRELIGFNINGDDGDEERQRDTDDNMLTRRQAD